MSALLEESDFDPDLEREQLKPIKDRARSRLASAVNRERRTSHLPPGCTERDAAVEELRNAETWASEMKVVL